MAKVAYCAGHGGFGVTAGKRSPAGEYEWDFNNVVAKAFAKELKKYKGVYLLRTDDSSGRTDVPLSTRTTNANSWGADIYVSFHHNAFKSKWGNHTGVETYYHSGSAKGKELASVVQTALVKAYGLLDRGLKTENLHITRETKMTAVLAEGAFMDSTIDIKKLRDKSVLQKAGVEVAKAVAIYLGLVKGRGSKPSNQQATKKEDKPAPSMKTLESGDTVTLSTNARKYATGETIPKSVKGKKYTIQQVKSDRVLLKEIYSWVYKKDVSGGSVATAKKPTSTANKIKSVGKIKVNKIQNFTYIYSKPNDKSNKLGQAKKNSTFNIAGSVTGWYEVIHKGKRAYIKSKYASRI